MTRGQFRTKNQAMNMRKPIWCCEHCHKWYHSNPKKMACVNCQCKAFHYFPSTAEANKFSELVSLLKYGKISRLELQPSYPIVINGQKICTYRADFRYRDSDDKEMVVDVKPKDFSTELFKLKKKLVENIYQIKIHEVN